jgi:hypothetical protein
MIYPSSWVRFLSTSDFFRLRVKKLHSQVVPEWTVVTGLLVMGGQGSEIFSVCMSRYSTITQHRKGVFPDFFIYLELEIFLLLEYNSNQTVYATLVIHAILDAGGICKSSSYKSNVVYLVYVDASATKDWAPHQKSLLKPSSHVGKGPPRLLPWGGPFRFLLCSRNF